MLDVGFSEVLVIFVLALVVLGPEKLPRVAAQLGRMVGRARTMARQFKEQLEEEVNLEQVRKAQAATPPKTAAVPEPEAQAQIAAQAPANSGPDPATFTADTFSHAHATDETGANPNHPNGAADASPAPPEVTAAAAPAETSATGPQRAEDAEAHPSTQRPVSPPTSSHERGS